MSCKVLLVTACQPSSGYNPPVVLSTDTIEVYDSFTSYVKGFIASIVILLILQPDLYCLKSFLSFNSSFQVVFIDFDFKSYFGDKPKPPDVLYFADHLMIRNSTSSK